MSIYVDPEEYSCPQEPEDLTDETKRFLRSIIMAIDWVQQDLAQLALQEDQELDNTELPSGGYEYRGSIYSVGDYFDE